ncbi:hypothetical protein QPJ96_05880 [Pantoea agglomerans]|nr:hypothetical protein [Pantoea agglomerans]WIL43078.1 hypothetical protein QPJ96_05880 [Pantoea agglomerans]
MKPLSERIKDFPADQFVDWLCLSCVDVREVRGPPAVWEVQRAAAGAVMPLPGRGSLLGHQRMALTKTEYQYAVTCHG